MAMELLSGPWENRFPRNVGLMLFNEMPEKFFPYSRIEIVHFPDDADSDEFIEIPPFSGPVNEQITSSLNYLKSNVLIEKVRKIHGEAKSVRIWNYPFQALEEAVANAIYHRDYNLREPVEIRIYSDSISILNYGGPDRSIKMEAFDAGIVKARRYRNRRLGDFLKELHLTEGKATGIPMIKRSLAENGSPKAFFDTDEARSFFLVEFKIHPAFKRIFIPYSVLRLFGQDDINKLLDWIIANLSDEKEPASDYNAINTKYSYGNEDSILKNDQNKITGNEVSNEVNILINSFIEAISENRIEKSNEVNAVAGNDVGIEVLNRISADIKKILSERALEILNGCIEPLSLSGIFQKIGLTKQTKTFNLYVKPLIKMNWIRLTEPEKPRSRNQKYYTSLKGIMVLKLCNYR